MLLAKNEFYCSLGKILELRVFYILFIFRSAFSFNVTVYFKAVCYVFSKKRAIKV